MHIYNIVLLYILYTYSNDKLTLVYECIKVWCMLLLNKIMTNIY